MTNNHQLLYHSSLSIIHVCLLTIIFFLIQLNEAHPWIKICLIRLQMGEPFYCWQALPIRLQFILYFIQVAILFSIQSDSALALQYLSYFYFRTFEGYYEK